MRHIVFSLLASTAFFGWIPQSPSSAEAVLPRDFDAKPSIRLTHSRELLGRFFALSGIHLTANEEDKVSDFIRDLLVQKLSLQKGLRAHRAIMTASKRHQMDPFFILAIIHNESRFNPKALGTSGEVGLMQIRPSTARWVAKHFGIRFQSAHALEDPALNIAIGTQYLAYLRNRFKAQSFKYVAAYNMGELNVMKKIGDEKEPRTYTKAVLAAYSRFYSEFRTFVRGRYAQENFKSSMALAKVFSRGSL